VKCPPKEVLFGGEAFLANYDEAKLSLGGPEGEHKQLLSYFRFMVT